MATKEQVKAAAKKRFRTQDVEIADGVKVTLRELSHTERDALMKRLFQTDDAGELLVKDGYNLYRENVRVNEEWLAATMTPEYTVTELLDPDWPDSLKRDLQEKALALNTVTVKDAAGN